MAAAALLSRLMDMALPLFPGDRDLRWSLRQVRYGFRHRVVGLRQVAVADLRVQKEPTLVPQPYRPPDAAHPRRAPPRVVVNPVDRFMPLEEGLEDRRLIHLPHSALLRLYDRTGRLPEDSDYARLLRVRALLQGRTVREAELAARVKRLLATYQSIRSSGYLGAGHRRERIVVLEKPIHPPTPTYRPQGLELFDGHHRAVVVTHLGVKQVQVLVTRAVKVADFDWQAEPFDEALWQKAVPGCVAGTSLTEA